VSSRRCRAIGVLLVLSAGAAVPLAEADASLDFDRTFNDVHEPPTSHYIATYRLADGEHRLEVWRDRSLHLRRRTDDAIETYVDRPVGDTEWSMVVLDLRRRIRTDIDRTSLFRIGHFPDWFSMAHSLSRPAGPYRLTEVPRREEPRLATAAPCRWYALSQGARTTRICWSVAQRAPLLIIDESDTRLWAIDHLDTLPLPGAVFAFDDRGFVRNDTHADIKGD
jgi:hypothetical protein